MNWLIQLVDCIDWLLSISNQAHLSSAMGCSQTKSSTEPTDNDPQIPAASAQQPAAANQEPTKDEAAAAAEQPNRSAAANSLPPPAEPEASDEGSQTQTEPNKQLQSLLPSSQESSAPASQTNSLSPAAEGRTCDDEGNSGEKLEGEEAASEQKTNGVSAVEKDAEEGERDEDEINASKVMINVEYTVNTVGIEINVEK